MLFLCLYNWGSIHTVICSMRIALVASVSCSRLFMCSMLRVVVFSFSLNSSLVGSTVHTNGSRDITNATYRRWYDTLNSVTTQSLHLFFSPKQSFIVHCNAHHYILLNRSPMQSFCKLNVLFFLWTSAFKHTLFGFWRCEKLLQRG